MEQEQIFAEVIEIFDDSFVENNTIIKNKIIIKENCTDDVIEISDDSENELIETTNNINSYDELLDLENAAYIPNYQPFNCTICLSDINCIEGVTLKNCLHNFCKDCLANTIKYSDDAEIKCPYTDEQYHCDLLITEREIKAIVSAEEYEKHLNLSLRLAENSNKNSFHCRTKDCIGWCIVEMGISEFVCPVCNVINCLNCKATHAGYTCQQYQIMVDPSQADEPINQMKQTGEAMACPKCQITITKVYGCDFLTCSMCKEEICWATRGPRWGPGGHGDTSGGCRCLVNSIKCHPACGNCH